MNLVLKIFQLLMVLCFGSILFYLRKSSNFQDFNPYKITDICLDEKKDDSKRISNILSSNDFKTNCSFENYNKSILDRGSFINNLDLIEHDFSDIEQKFSKYQIQFGGVYRPKNCKSEQKIAIIISYRDRLTNLRIFLSNMYPFLINQNLTFGLYLIEPIANLTWNKGYLYNIGFIESLKDSDNQWDCFFFHDIDMLPEDVRNIYKCDYDSPVHYSVAVKKYNYSQEGFWGSSYYGGVNAITRSQFVSINGLSNLYFGWGVQDDDLFYRCKAFFKIIRKRDSKINRYYSLDHKESDFRNKKAKKILKKVKSKYETEGIREGLNTTFYKLVKITKYPLFTHMFVNHEDLDPALRASLSY